MFQNHLDIGKNIRVQKLNKENASFNYHVSVLSFFLYLYLNKDDDDLSKFILTNDNDNNSIIKNEKENTYINDISKIHMNTYATDNIYDLIIHNEGVDLNRNQLDFDMSINILFEENALYPLQRFFTYLPKELRDKIRSFQNQVKNGFNIIKSEEDLSKEEDELLFEEEKKDEIDDDDDEPEN